MASEQTLELTVKKLRRTVRVEIFTDLELEGNYTIRVWRETVYTDTDTGTVLGHQMDSVPIVRKLSSFEPGDPVLTLAAQIAAIADAWDQEPPQTDPPVEPSPET